MKKYLLLLALVCLLGNRALAEDVTIDFTGFGDKNQTNANLDWVNYNHPVLKQNGNTVRTFSDRFWVETPSDWQFHGSSTFNESYLQKKENTQNSTVHIGDVKAGDVVTIWGESGNNGGGCNVTSGNIKNSSSGSTNFQFSQSTPSHTFTMSSDGQLDIQFYNNYSGIRKITVQSQQQQQEDPSDPVFNYDPGFEVYDMFEVKTNNGVTYSTSDAGFALNGGTAQYINLTNNANLTFNERIAVNPESGWTFNRGLQAPNYNINNSNWYNFSICNLKEGDRVIIYYTGTAPTFSSQGQGGAYNGCPAFKDMSNDGDFNSDEGDHYISQGMSVEKIDALDRREGTISDEEGHDVNIYTSATYVITQDGHLDLGILNGSDTRIVKIKIYSDHQATMVDEYDQPDKTYWAHFDVTGELKAKEHIVPGGLEVHVGNNDENQHAIVVSSKFGPMSYVNAARRFKIPGIEATDIEGTDKGTYTINFNLTSQLPKTGTFYKFIAQEAGKMTVKFQGNSMYYYRYDLAGDAIYYNTDQGSGRPYDWEARFDRANEQTYGQASTYYLMEEGSNGAPIVKQQISVNNGAEGVITYQLEKGHVYYLYGVWRDGASYDNILITTPDQIDKESLVPYYCGVAEVYDIEFCPTKKIHPLAKWVPNGTTSDEDLADVTGYTDTDLRVKLMTGNITRCTPYIQNGKLKIKDITFATDDNNVYKNRGGVILIKVGDVSDRYDPVYAFTVAYSADPQYDKENADGSRGHTWDFSSNSLNGLTWNSPYDINGATPEDLGTYYEDYFNKDWDENKANGGSLLWREMNYQVDGIDRSDWMFNYRIERADGNNSDPRFLSKYDMEGDNADMLYDTEGIIIEASSNQSCMFNEFKGTDIHSSTTDPDRYVGILPGGTFRIPWLEANDRVIIWMGSGTGSGNEQMVFNITNARDAEYKEISATDNYVAGGSQWNGANNDNNYRGCYHFFAKEKGDMIFKLATEGSSMCKIYKIQIYRGDRIDTNEIMGATENDNKYLLWSRAADPNDTNDNAYTEENRPNWTLQYFGKDQKLADGTNSVENDIISQTGNLAKAITTNTTANTFTYEHALGEIGTFRMRGKDMEKNMKYVADYADHNVTVAYQQTQTYPYTWDFMDVTGFSGDDLQAEDQLEAKKPTGFTDTYWESIKDTYYEITSNDLSLWEIDSENGAYWLRLNSQSKNPKAKDNIFQTAKSIDGNQVWANGKVVPETQGLWFYTENNVQASGGKWIISDAGMQLNGNSGWPYTLVVPNVPAGAAVYLRMKNSVSTPHFAYSFKGEGGSEVYPSDGKPMVVPGTESEENEVNYAEYIIAIKNNGDTKRHLVLSFGGYELKKLAVSTDPKAVNTKGWTSESHDHAIDAALTPYLTGKPIKTYFAGTPDYESRTLVLADISNSENKHVMPAETGCVLFNEAAKDSQNDVNYKGGKVEIFDGGFHLFVPDMHDGAKLAAPTGNMNMLKPQLAEVKPLAEGDDTNTYYVLSYNYYDLDADGKPKSTAIAGPEMFYRVAKTGIGLRANSAYLALPTSEVKPKNRGTVEAPAKCYSFVFADYDDFFASNLNGIATEIEGVETVTPQTVQEGWYTINGQKLSGRPTTSGLYIVNGKKVLVK